MSSNEHINQDDGGLTTTIRSSNSYKQASPQFSQRRHFFPDAACPRKSLVMRNAGHWFGWWLILREPRYPKRSVKKQSGKPQSSRHIKHLTALTEEKLRHIGVNSSDNFLHILPRLLQSCQWYLLLSPCSVSTATTCSSHALASCVLFTTGCNCALFHLIFLFSHLAPLSVLVQGALPVLNFSSWQTGVNVNVGPQSSGLHRAERRPHQETRYECAHAAVPSTG